MLALIFVSMRQLGDGTTTQRNTAVRVDSLGDDNIQVIAGGEAGWSAVLKQSGAVYTVGEGSHGELGIGSTSDQRGWRQVSNIGTDAAQLAGYSYGCEVIKKDGSLWGWGRNNYVSTRANRRH